MALVPADAEVNCVCVYAGVSRLSPNVEDFACCMSWPRAHRHPVNDGIDGDEHV